MITVSANYLRPALAARELKDWRSRKTNEEVWFTNSDARTHILYLGTTGAGKTEGLKSMVTNALCWGSGFVYVDGKAQNTLWSSLFFAGAPLWPR
jgi:ABC-type uncharacterized transport system ATPase subunit